MNKHTNKKTRCTKNYAMTAKEVAAIAGCSESYVKQVRANMVALQSPKAQLILSIDSVGMEGKSVLVQEIERIVKL